MVTISFIANLADRIDSFSRKAYRFFVDNIKVFWGFLITYIFVKEIYYVLSIPLGVPPDEMYHVNVSQIYTRIHAFWPINAVKYILLGPLNGTSNLYYWIMSFFLRINVFGVSEYLWLRFANLIFYLVSMVFFYLILKKIIRSKVGIFVGMLLISNITMISLLYSGVNYDNLANMFCIVAIYIFIRLIENLSVRDSIILGIIVALGTWSKFTVVPFAALILFAYLGLLYIKRKDLSRKLNWNIKSLKEREYSCQFKKRFFANVSLVIILTALISINLYIYAVNLSTFGSLTPHCENYLTSNECLKNAIYKRGFDMRADDLALKPERFNVLSYFLKWQRVMLDGVTGYMSHKPFYQNKYMILAIYLTLLSSFIFLILNLRKLARIDLTDKQKILFLAYIFTTYGLILFFFQNYKTYLDVNVIEVGLQGRYIFPVIWAFLPLYLYPLFFAENEKHVRTKELLLLIFYLVFCFFLEPFLILVNRNLIGVI